MLTAQQKAEAEKKLKNIGEELAHEEQIKSTIKKSSKLITEGLASLKQDKKAQLELLSKLANSVLPQKILTLDSVTNTLVLLQDKLKNQRDKCNRDAILLIEEKQRFQSGIDQIKKTILNIQKTIKESVQEETNKRKKIEDDLDNSLNQIRTKTTEFETESLQFDKDNAELQQKIQELKAKLQGIQANFKVKAEQKDEEVRLEKEQLTEKLKTLQLQVQKVTEINKEYSLLQKKNFDNKLSFYLKTKKIPEFSSSFENSAKTLDSCKEELLKGVCRMNIAWQSIEASQKITSQNNILYLIELKRQQQKEIRIEEIKKQKEAVRARIIQLQSRIKQKKAATENTN